MKKYKILVVDYEPRSVEQITRALGGERFELEIASNGLEAIQAFHRVEPDLTLIEAMIPKKHGFEVCQELKATAHGRSTPILIVTAVYKGRKYRHQAMHHYGANGYLEKPISDDALRSAIRDALGADDDGHEDVTIEPALTEPTTSEPRPAAAPPAIPEPARSKAPRPAPARPDGAGDAAMDPTELEILDRLDSLIPGDSGAGEPR